MLFARKLEQIDIKLLQLRAQVSLAKQYRKARSHYL